MPITRNSVFVDTSGWHSYLDAAQSDHQAMEAHYHRLLRQKRQFVTTNYIHTELVALFAIRSRFPQPRVLSTIGAIKSSPSVIIIHIDAATDEAAWNLLKSRPDKEWSLVDASSFVIMQRYSMTEALTTDHHFTQAGFTCLP